MSMLIGEVDPSAVTVDDENGIDAWFRVLLHVGQWYAVSLVAGIRNHPDAYPGIRWGGLSEVLDKDPKDIPEYLVISRMIFAQFGLVLVHGELARLFHESPHRAPISLIRSVENALHEELVNFWALRVVAAKKGQAIASVADEMFEASLHSLRFIYPAEPPDDYEAQGAFSAINLTDFVRMAARDDRALRKYGKSHLARAFEQQLALLVQSLGGLVVQTRPGERTVDLFCISVDVHSPFSFLVEAKSTKRAYGLPSDDERALVEYIRESRRLSTLPRLRFVLLVAPSPSRNLEKKLKAVETGVGVPVRFLSAKGLAHLRDLVVGPQLLGEIAELLLNSPYIVGDDLGDRVVAVVREKHEAHENLVRAVLGLPNKRQNRRFEREPGDSQSADS